jgi:hypothetical protein
MIVRKSTYDREIERLQTELRLTREEYDRQRAGLVADIRDAFEEDIIGRLRREYREERFAANRRHNQLLRLAELTRALLRVNALDPSAPVIEPEKAERSIRRLLGEIEESEREPPRVTTEELARQFAAGKRTEWPPESGKTFVNPYEQQMEAGK